MKYTTLLLDIAPVSSGIGLVAGAAFFLVFLAVAFIAFKMLRKTVKMAFRIVIVGIILAIAVVGSVAFWWLGSSTGSSKRPERPRPTQSR